MNDIRRGIDEWLKWAAVVGPLLGFVFGNCSGAIITYQAIKNDGTRIDNLEKWRDKENDLRDKQEEFNRTTIAAIARLKALIKDIER